MEKLKTLFEGGKYQTQKVPHSTPEPNDKHCTYYGLVFVKDSL